MFGGRQSTEHHLIYVLREMVRNDTILREEDLICGRGLCVWGGAPHQGCGGTRLQIHGGSNVVGDGRHRDHPGSSQCGGRDVLLQQQLWDILSLTSSSTNRKISTAEDTRTRVQLSRFRGGPEGREGVKVKIVLIPRQAFLLPTHMLALSQKYS